MLAELSPEVVAQVLKAATLLKKASRICVLTGAGISAESGIPTFRNKQTGLWEQYRAEDLASLSAFSRDPQLVWSWYQWRRQIVHNKKPNPAHYALAQWQQYTDANNNQLTIITQNVDDLHEQAGSTTAHLHGHLWRNRCSQCDTPYNQHSELKHSFSEAKNKDDYDNELIHCHSCDGYIRPDIVWFGEPLPVEEWQIAEEAAANCQVFISIGTSSMVYPAAGLAQLAWQNGAKIIEINPNPTPNTLIDITLSASAGIVMPLLVAQITKTS